MWIRLVLLLWNFLHLDDLARYGTIMPSIASRCTKRQVQSFGKMVMLSPALRKKLRRPCVFCTRQPRVARVFREGARLLHLEVPGLNRPKFPSL